MTHARGHAQLADRGLLGAGIRTRDPAQPFATAPPCATGSVEVGDDARVRDVCDARTQIIDGGGLALVPELFYAHQHPLLGADDTVGADLAGLATLDELRAALADEHARCEPGQWVRGHSLEYATFDGAELEGALIADAVDGAPAYLTFFDFTPRWRRRLRWPPPALTARARSTAAPRWCAGTAGRRAPC